MPFLLRIAPLLVTATLVLSANQVFCQTSKVQQEAILLQKVLTANHYSPRKFNDSLSAEIFDQYLKALDPYQLYFTANDHKNFSVLKLTLDNELLGQGWKFFPMVAGVYKERLTAAATICETVASKPLTFTPTEKLILAGSEPAYAATPQELTQRWTKWLKFQALWQLVNTYENEPASTLSEKQLLAKEPEVREKIKKVELRKIKKVAEHPQGFEHFLKTAYFNAISTCFDPHSNYLAKSDLQNFQSQLSIEGLSFGFDLDENELGDVEIVRLVPGGPAWKSNELHQGDVILKLKWKNKPAYELAGAGLMEVENILQASNEDLMEITIRSSAGTDKTVQLKKEKLRAEDNIVKSFLLQGTKKAGYISLPGFYTDWDRNSAQGCANDVAKEIVKLKKENIDGLIIDLRYNGGGNLGEALNLAGIFIDEGPLLQIQGKERKPAMLRDMNRGTVYDGPLVVMVNGQSASASELLAATLQDYNRAVIAGSGTFGKATAQSIFPLDPAEKNLNNPKSPYGFATITQDKIFRVTGNTAQLNGVQPDILLPDVYEIYLDKEAQMPNALPAEIIARRIAFEKLPALPLSKLQEASKARLLKNEGFKKIEALRKSPNYKPLEDIKELPLTLAFFRGINKDQDLWNNLFASDETTDTTLKVANPPFNQALLDLDTYGKEVNENIIENLQADIYLEESLHILTDLINQTNR